MRAYRDKEVAKGGDDAHAETHDQCAVRSDHELSCCSHGDAASQGGILDVHLLDKTKISHEKHIDKDRTYVTGLEFLQR